MIVAMNIFEVAQALDDARTLRAQEQPVHAKEPQRRGVEKEIDDFVLTQAPFARERERIDAKQRIVVSRANVGLEPG
jgi:hypothetical protein